MTSFKGLWTSGFQNEVGTVKRNNCPIYTQRVIYHPFKDETQSEIDEVMKKADKQKCKDVYNEVYQLVTKYLILMPVVGEPLSVTKDEYNKIRQMKEDPGNDYMNTTSIGNCYNPPEEVKEIAEKL